MVIILISAAFGGAALIRGKALGKRRRLFQCGYPKVRRLLEEIQYASYKQYLFRLLSFRNAMKTPLYLPHIFLLCLKRNNPQTEASAAKILFFSVYIIGTTCFDECYLFYVITGKHYFSWACFNPHVVAFFEAIVLKKLRNNSTMLTPKIQNKTDYFS